MSFEKPWGNYLLDAIVETIAPDTINFWPQTIAWKIIFALVTIFILKKSYQSWKNYQANAYRREALAWLAQCSLSNQDNVRQLPALLRKTAILANQRLINESSSLADVQLKHKKKSTQNIANITGKIWSEWLDKNCIKSDFNNNSPNANVGSYTCEKLLSQLAYVPAIDVTDKQFNEGLKQLTQQIKLWITFHDLSVEQINAPKQVVLGESK